MQSLEVEEAEPSNSILASDDLWRRKRGDQCPSELSSRRWKTANPRETNAGVLTPEEWRPLLGSILLLRSWAKTRLIKSLASSIIMLAVYYPLILCLGYQGYLGTASSGLFAVLLFPFVPGITAWLIFQGLSWRSGPTARNDILKADRQVALVIGSEQFLAVLEKIDAKGFTDNQRRIPRSFKTRQPTIQERIQNLRSVGTTPSMTEGSSAHPEP